MSKFWSKEETLWNFALYGTAVGVGTLFLSIQLGSVGAVILFITALVAWPLTCWPHKALCQFILSSKTSTSEGIAGAVTHYYGKEVGNLITTLYSIAFFVVVLIYAVTVTNPLTEQPIKHITIDLRIHMLVSFGVVLVLNLIFLMDRQATIWVMGFLVLPLIAYFLFLSLYLTGSWQPALLTGQMPFDQHTLHQVWISILVAVFAFNHMPTISTFAIDRREKYGEQVVGKYKKTTKVACVIIYLSVLLSVFNCLFSTPINYIEDAKNEGVTILPAPSMMPNAPAWLLISGIVVAAVAMLKSLLGTYFGVTEGTTEVVKASLHQMGMRKSRAFSHALLIMLISVITLIICCTNPNAVSMIHAISGPLIAMILSIMPALSTYLIPALKPYRSVGNLITPIIGLLCVSAVSFDQNALFSGSFQ